VKVIFENKNISRQELCHVSRIILSTSGLFYGIGKMNFGGGGAGLGFWVVVGFLCDTALMFRDTIKYMPYH
jgi:hypothetical protein